MTGGEEGECPEWYRRLKAAKELDAKPWELDDVPVFWVERAFTAQVVEIEAREAKRKWESEMAEWEAARGASSDPEPPAQLWTPGKH